ncbi:MAG: SWIM zinc finger family protein, partial [Alphaproteobacteria bacterium]|nr:SWIM zinc finger family protein [Alphaproteobacteria bacterium]
MTEPQSGRTKRRRSAATPTGKPPRPRFAVAALRRQVGETVFERGEDYFQEGAVALLVVEAKRVVAQVAGTHDYRTEVVARGETIGGRCSCPAFADWGVCKHMVAVALAANEADGDPAGDGGALARIRAHLATKNVEALVETIVGLAENDPVLLRTLDMAAVGAQADDGTVRARLRKAIDGATRIRGFVEYRDAGGWAGGVDDALDAVAELIPNGRAALAMELAEHALDGIEEALGSIDDSDGHGTALMARVEEIHLAAAQAAQPDPVELAHTLFSREIDGEYDTFTGAAERYAEVLGEAGLSEYRRLAAAAWEKVPARTGRSKDEGAYRDDRLMAILDVFAAREGDVDAQIALRAKNLSSAWRYVQLVSFCREQGREAEALRRAEEGLWLFEDDR